MSVAQARLQTARQRLVGQQPVEMHGRLRDAYMLVSRGDSRMEIGERRGAFEPIGFGTKPSKSCRTRSVQSINPRSNSWASMPSRARPS